MTNTTLLDGVPSQNLSSGANRIYLVTLYRGAYDPRKSKTANAKEVKEMRGFIVKRLSSQVRNQKGFTLAEMLVIMGTLVALGAGIYSWYSRLQSIE